MLLFVHTLQRLIAFSGLPVLLTLTGCGGGLDVEQANANARPGTGFLVKSTVVNGEPRRYGLYIPPDYSPARTYPVILFLHGLFEGGNDGVGGMRKGLGPVINEHPDRFPCIAIFPQSSGTWSSDGNQAIALADLDAVQREYRTDTNRVILTGVSTGGFGTWSLGAAHPERFAGLVPMCSDAPHEQIPRLLKMPIWCFHSSGDFIIPGKAARQMCEKINTSGGTARFTSIHAMDHNISPQAYSDPALASWMLTQHRSATTP